MTVENALVPIVYQGEIITSANRDKIMEDIATSGLVPAQYANKPKAIAIALQFAYELGITKPLQALNKVDVVQSRPALKTKAALALCQSRSDILEQFYSGVVGTPGTDSYGAKCTAKRAGYPEQSVTFTVADAKRAGLWGKQGPWSQFPDDMLWCRAACRILDRTCGDILGGIAIAEIVQDIEEIKPEPVAMAASHTESVLAKIKSTRPVVAAVAAPEETDDDGVIESELLPANETVPDVDEFHAKIASALSRAGHPGAGNVDVQNAFIRRFHGWPADCEIVADDRQAISTQYCTKTEAPKWKRTVERMLADVPASE